MKTIEKEQSFLDFVDKQAIKKLEDGVVWILMREYAVLKSNFERGLIFPLDFVQGSVAIVDTLKTRTLGRKLLETYQKQL